MINFTLKGLIHGMDVEIALAVDDPNDIAPLVLMYKNAGMSELPRFTRRDDAPFEPFSGIVEKVEETTTKKGDKQMFIAHIRPNVAEGETPKDLVAVKYMPPKSTWRVGDKVQVVKNDKGWLELKETEQPNPF